MQGAYFEASLVSPFSSDLKWDMYQHSPLQSFWLNTSVAPQCEGIGNPIDSDSGE